MTRRKGRAKKAKRNRHEAPVSLRDFRRLVMHESGRSQAAELLRNQRDFLEARDSVGETALHYCAVEGFVDAVKWLIERGAAVDTIDHSQTTPLMHAARLGHLEMCRCLIENGAAVRATNEGLDTALHYAAAGGYTELCTLLIANGADIEAKNDLAETAADLALPRKREKVVAALSDSADP